MRGMLDGLKNFAIIVVYWTCLLGGAVQLFFNFWMGLAMMLMAVVYSVVAYSIGLHKKNELLQDDLYAIRQSHKNTTKTKFPWKCPSCFQLSVWIRSKRYVETVKINGVDVPIEIQSLEIPTCKNCGRELITPTVEKSITSAVQMAMTNHVESAEELGMEWVDEIP